MADARFLLAPQREAEELFLQNVLARSFDTHSLDSLANFISHYNAFQDLPFSSPDLLPWLVSNYRSSRYIYVVRDSHSWYQSLVNHHIRRRLRIEPTFSSSGSLIWTVELRRASLHNHYRGTAMLEAVTKLYGTAVDDPYNKGHLVAYNLRHVRSALALLPKMSTLFINFHELGRRDTLEELRQFVGAPASTSLRHMNSARPGESDD